MLVDSFYRPAYLMGHFWEKKGKNYICVSHISNIHSWSKHNKNWRFNWTNKNGNQAAHCVAVMSHIKEASQPTGYGANPSSLLEPCSKTDLVPLLLNITKQVLVPPFTPTKLQMAITHQENKVTQPNMLSWLAQFSVLFLENPLQELVEAP